MLAQSSGSFAQGTAFTGGSVVSSGQGSFAQGAASGASAITASGNGSFAQGQATAGNAITASSPGSMAVGASAAGAITATATNAVQFGVGGNAQADSVSVGTGPRLKGTTGAPGTPRNGDLWVANNYVYIRSNGVSCKCVNAAM